MRPDKGELSAGDLAPFLDFDALLAANSDTPNAPIAVAVSGGGDSLAMMHWAHASRRSLVVLTVDHQLRSESAKEALLVSRLAGEMGHMHQTLIWNAPRKQQSHARQARHRLLAAAARKAGCRILLLGHTLDDVVETILMRKRRGVTRAVLAGPLPMSPSPVWPEGRGLTLMRPLLHRTRQALRHDLRALDQAWCDDPSNEDRRFERTRVRQFLQRHPGLLQNMFRLTPDLLSAHANRRAEIGRVLASDAVQIDDDALVQCHLDRRDPRLAHVLPYLVRASAGHDLPVRAEAVTDALQALQMPDARRTLGGAWLQAGKAGLLIGRDPAQPGKMDSCGLWDGRFERAPETQMDQTPSYLVRASQPPGDGWRQIIRERIDHISQLYQTPLNRPV